ncbi:MAG: hypothetical protein GXP38_06600 [Chloroflexi bacterium]|nr:hypothetical protein [Chloroflexota bacterium]
MTIDWSLIVTLFFVFFVTLLGAWLRSRRKDECLQAFENYHVTLERTNGNIMWGRLSIAPTGLELLYRNAVQDENHIESSYVLYAPEYQTIQAIYRYADDLDEENRKRRAKDLSHWFHPSPLRLLLRKSRNFLTTASESLNEVINILVGRIHQPMGAYFNEASEKSLKRFGGEIISYAGFSQDPLLERFIGQRVVVELVEDDEVHEHVGLFKNYSSQFLEILDVQFPCKQTLTIEQDGVINTEQVTAIAKNGNITLNNQSDAPILVHSLRAENGEEQLLNVVVDVGEQITVHQNMGFEKAELQLKVVRELDMILPRSRALVRHRAGYFQPVSLTDIVTWVGRCAKTRGGSSRKNSCGNNYSATPKTPWLLPTSVLCSFRKGNLPKQKSGSSKPWNAGNLSPIAVAGPKWSTESCNESKPLPRFPYLYALERS